MTWGKPLSGAVLVLAMAACGENGPGSCPPGQTGVPPNCMPIAIPSPCVQTPVYTNSGAMPSRILIYTDFSVPDSGRLDMTLDWTFATSPIGLYLVPANTCTLEEFNERSCNFLLRSEPPGSKPRRISRTGLQAGNYRFLIANFSGDDESGALQIVLSKGDTCPALAGLPPSSAARSDPSMLLAEGAGRW